MSDSKLPDHQGNPVKRDHSDSDYSMRRPAKMEKIGFDVDSNHTEKDSNGERLRIETNNATNTCTINVSSTVNAKALLKEHASRKITRLVVENGRKLDTKFELKEFSYPQVIINREPRKNRSESSHVSETHQSRNAAQSVENFYRLLDTLRKESCPPDYLCSNTDFDSLSDLSSTFMETANPLQETDALSSHKRLQNSAEEDLDVAFDER